MKAKAEFTSEQETRSKDYDGEFNDVLNAILADKKQSETVNVFNEEGSCFASFE